MTGHTCVRFVKSGSIRMGQLSIDVDGKKTSMSSAQTLWKCRDCGEVVWLQTGIDPNVQTAASARPQGRKIRKM